MVDKGGDLIYYCIGLIKSVQFESYGTNLFTIITRRQI